MAKQSFRLLCSQHRIASPKVGEDGKLVGAGKVFIKQGDVIESDDDLTKVFPGRFELVKKTAPVKEEKK